MLLSLEVGGNPRWWTLISSIVTQTVVLYSPDFIFYVGRLVNSKVFIKNIKKIRFRTDIIFLFGGVERI